MTYRGNPEERRKYQRSYASRRKALHLCAKCGKQDADTLAGRSRCKACSEKANARRRLRRERDPAYRERDNRDKRDTYAWMKKHHYCHSCKKVDAYTMAGHALCAECSVGKAREDLERRRANAKRRRERRKAEGVCSICGRPLPGTAYPYLTCERCRAKDRERRRRKREADGAVSRAMYKELGLCVNCGRPRIKGRTGYDGKEIMLCERCYANALKWAEAGRRAFEEKHGMTYRSWATGNEFRFMKKKRGS